MAFVEHQFPEVSKQQGYAMVTALVRQCARARKINHDYGKQKTKE